MTLAIGWPHDPGETRADHPRPGPMTLAIGWPHDLGENCRDWPHDPGDRHAASPRWPALPSRLPP